MKVTFNRSISRISGKLDDLVFREQNGQTVAVPFSPRPDNPSPAQLDGRDRFKEAQAYAKRVLSDPLKRERYRTLAAARKCPPNALLISNFLNPPVLDHLELTDFQGRLNDPIRVLASDGIEVTAVTITVRRADGTVIESGSAARDHDVWVYRCSTSAVGEGLVQIEVAAQNRAGAIGKVSAAATV
jgi:hypothetical protein